MLHGLRFARLVKVAPVLHEAVTDLLCSMFTWAGVHQAGFDLWWNMFTWAGVHEADFNLWCSMFTWAGVQAERSLESIYAELVSNGIIRPCPPTRLSDFLGTLPTNPPPPASTLHLPHVALSEHLSTPVPAVTQI